MARTRFFLTGNKVVADTTITMRKSEADALVAELNTLRAFAKFVKYGVTSGNIRSAQFMDMSDPNAEEWPIRSLGQYVDEVLATSNPA